VNAHVIVIGAGVAGARSGRGGLGVASARGVKRGCRRRKPAEERKRRRTLSLSGKFHREERQVLVGSARNRDGVLSDTKYNELLNEL